MFTCSWSEGIYQMMWCLRVDGSRSFLDGVYSQMYSNVTFRSMNWQSRVWTKFGGVTEDPDSLLVCGVIWTLDICVWSISVLAANQPWPLLKFNLNRRHPSIDTSNLKREMFVKRSFVIPEFWAQETILFNGDKPHCLFFTDCAGFLRASVRALKQPHVVYQCDSDSREGKICGAPQRLLMILWIPENDVPQHKYIALHGNVI